MRQHRVHHAVLSDLERELFVAPHGTEPALSSPLRGARAAFDFHGQPLGLSFKATQGLCWSKTVSNKFFFNSECKGQSEH